MLRVSTRLNTVDLDAYELKPYVWAGLKWFWRFSNFYGNYKSLPPWERRRDR